MGLSEQQMRYYRTFGFLKFPGLFADEIATITDRFEAVWAASGRNHDYLKRAMLVPFIDQDEYLSDLLDDPRIDETAEAILGDDYNYGSSDGNYYVGDTRWHSDKEPLDTIESFKMAFYLDAVTGSTGCLRVIPGSAFGGDPFAAALHEAVPFSSNSRPEEFWGVAGNEVPGYPIESNPGDVLLFNHKVKHSSWGGGDRRRMFTLNFQQRVNREDLPFLQKEILAQAEQRNDGSHGPYGDAMLRTADARRMKHLEQRLAVARALGAT